VDAKWYRNGTIVLIRGKGVKKAGELDVVGVAHAVAEDVAVVPEL
jgi:hypothetical protein